MSKRERVRVCFRGKLIADGPATMICHEWLSCFEKDRGGRFLTCQRFGREEIVGGRERTKKEEERKREE